MEFGLPALLLLLLGLEVVLGLLLLALRDVSNSLEPLASGPYPGGESEESVLVKPPTPTATVMLALVCAWVGLVRSLSVVARAAAVSFDSRKSRRSVSG